MPRILVQPEDFETAKAANLSVNGPCENDGRGCIPQTLDALQGAYTDDEPRRMTWSSESKQATMILSCSALQAASTAGRHETM